MGQYNPARVRNSDVLTAFRSFFVKGFPVFESSAGAAGGWGAEKVTAFWAFSISGSPFEDDFAFRSRFR